MLGNVRKTNIIRWKGPVSIDLAGKNKLKEKMKLPKQCEKKTLLVFQKYCSKTSYLNENTIIVSLPEGFTLSWCISLSLILQGSVR